MARTKEERQPFNFVMQKSIRSWLIDSIGGYESVKYGNLGGLIFSSRRVEEVCGGVICAGKRDSAGKGDAAGKINGAGSLG